MSEPPDSDATPRPAFPPTGRVAAIDYGTVRIGVAVSDAERRFASPLETYQRRTTAADARYFAELVQRERLVGWVVGLPVHGDGRESAKSREARQFGVWLSASTGLPVVYYDERYTTVEADAWMNAARLSRRDRQARRDKLAAQILLSAFLESPQRAGTDPGALD